MALVFCKDQPEFAGNHFSFGIFLVVTSPYLIEVDILVAARRGLAIVLKACEFDSFACVKACV